MLSSAGMKALSIYLDVSCNVLHIFPYTWNPVTFRLSHAKSVNLLFYKFHRLAHWVECCFIVSRLIISITWDGVPNRIRVVSSTWTIAGFLSALCYVQFELKRREILYFANSLFAYMKQPKVEAADERRTSLYVIFGAIMLAIGAPVHATMIFEQPCSPQFWSSLVLLCDHAGDDMQSYISELPYFFLECYAVTVNLSTLFFNWMLVYLGLNWIRLELLSMRRKPYSIDGDLEPLHWDRKKYRKIQFISVALNDAFSIYLAWFPAILIGVTAMMMYGTSRFWYLRIHSYMMYPACGIRCCMEAFTILAMAGEMNAESRSLLEEWKPWWKQDFAIGENSSGGNNKEKKRDSWISSFQNSCAEIKCSAGSLYTFEKSIVLCSVSHCVVLTMNLWLLTS